MRLCACGLGLVLVAPPLAAQATRPAPVRGSLAAHQRLARQYLSEKRDAEAIAELRQAARLGPLERDLGLALARMERLDGNPARAEQQLRSVADRFRSVRALLGLAQLQSERRDTTGALESLRRARALAPSSEDVLRASAEAALAADAPLQAIRELEALTRLYPTVGRYHYLDGLALMKAGDAAAAVDPLREAERLEPRQPPTLIALGQALNSRRLYEEARSRLLGGLSLAPDSVEALAALAEAEEGLGELNEAEAHAQRALARTDTQPVASLVLGMVRLKQGRYAEAREALLKAAAADPSSAKAHYQLSLVFARLGDPASAERHLELYRGRARELERRASEVRALAGLSTGGMRP